MHREVYIKYLTVRPLNILKVLQKCGFYGPGKTSSNALASFLLIFTFDY
jgi:hypothetical protein